MTLRAGHGCSARRCQPRLGKRHLRATGLDNQDIVFNQLKYCFTGTMTVVFLGIGNRFLCRTIGQAHAKCLDGGCHRVGRVHAATRARAGNSSLLDFEQFEFTTGLLRDLAKTSGSRILFSERSGIIAKQLTLKK